MKYKKIILGVALALACFSSLNANALTETKVKKTETQAAAPNVYWTDGYGRVSYTTNSIISPVVKIALKEFAGDMKAVTGFDAKEKSGAPIQIYQLDQLTNKEFSAVENSVRRCILLSPQRMLSTSVRGKGNSSLSEATPAERLTPS